MTLHDLLLPTAAAGYAVATFLLYRSTLSESPDLRRAAVGLTALALLLHGIAQAQHWLATPAPEINLLNALSLCALVVAAMLLGSLALRQSLFEAGLVALPIAVAVLLAEWSVDLEGNLLGGLGAGMTLHVLSSVVSFGLLAIAAVYALFVAVIDHFLRHHHLNRLVRALPALDVLERLLFRLIAAGFAVLTVALVTGVMFVDDLLAQHLAHKTVLSVAAWLVFGVLLWGRWRHGWRGRLAVRLTLAGVAMLLLSYFGSKLVLEQILHQSWQGEPP